MNKYIHRMLVDSDYNKLEQRMNKLGEAGYCCMALTYRDDKIYVAVMVKDTGDE